MWFALTVEVTVAHCASKSHVHGSVLDFELRQFS